MQKLSIIALSALLMSAHCTTAKKTPSDIYIDTQQLAGRSFHKLFVEVQTIDIQLRNTIETSLVAALVAQGYEGIKSVDQIPFSLEELKLPSEEEIKLKAQESGSDAILLVTPTRHNESLGYNRGTEQKQNKQMGAGLLSAALNKSGDIKPVAPVNKPGSYSYTPPGFVLKNQLYELAGTALLFAGHSELKDITAPENMSKAYAMELVDVLRTNKLLK